MSSYKQSFTFSLHQSVMAKFFELIREKKINKNELVDHLIGAWVNDQEYKLILCPICSAQYSSKLLGGCPQCNLKDRLNEKQQTLFELENRRNKMIIWLQEGKAQPVELEKIDTEIAIIKKELE